MPPAFRRVQTALPHTPKASGRAPRSATPALPPIMRSVCRFSCRNYRHSVLNVALVVGGDPFQTADRDRLFFDALASAGWFAWTIANAAQNAGKDVGLPVHHVRIGIAAGHDQPDVFRDWRVCRAGILTVDHLVKMGRISCVCRLHTGFFVSRLAGIVVVLASITVVFDTFNKLTALTEGFCK